jgi:single-stranded-DNA-specific exonuclease
MRWETLNKSSDDDLLDVLLENRGMKTKKEKEEFLNPPKMETYFPQQLGIKRTQLKRAIQRVKKAVKEKEQIIVYGDYDADGVCATAIVWESLHNLGANALPFIPNRFKDGYGINTKSIENIKLQTPNVKLIITVDNGIVAYEALKKAKRLGIDVIVTDHHTYEKKPETYAIIHTTKTSGSGVAWFFAKALDKKVDLGLSAMGTIADQLPLVGFNRSIVKYGLEALNKTSRLGLRKLYATAGLIGKTIGTYEVNFMIAPRINASGRLAQGMDALRLLCTKSPEKAERLAVLLNGLNAERQAVVDSAVKLTEEKLSSSGGGVVILSSAEYHEGVIGLIAGKLVEKSGRPAIVMSQKAEIAKASARSISGFNIIEAIRAHEELIVEGGGHEMAAGFTIEVEKIPLFTKKINSYAKALLTPELLKRKIKVDTELPFNRITEKVYNMLRHLEPYGIGNPTPVFVTRDVTVVSQKLVGSGKHLKLVLGKDGSTRNGIFFNRDTKVSDDRIDVCYRLNENTWNGKSNIELIIKDIKKWSQNSGN